MTGNPNPPRHAKCHGVLFIVATPIGNLGDITARAIDTLTDADLILAEDTRRAAKLLQHLNIRTPVQSYHEHNETARVKQLLRRLTDGAHIALISDAGTPLISDPGYPLVQRARECGVTVTPLPGASALTAALSASGQSVARFCFEGFLSAKVEARRRRLTELKNETRTLVFYEAGRRVIATMECIGEVCGARPVTVAREISKKFETFYHGTTPEVIAAMSADECHRRGEFVIVLGGATESPRDLQRATEVLELLLTEMPDIPTRRAAKIAAQIIGGNRNELYEIAVRIKNRAQ